MVSVIPRIFAETERGIESRIFSDCADEADFGVLVYRRLSLGWRELGYWRARGLSL